MTITRSQFITLLEPKISEIWYEPAAPWPIEYTRFCNVKSTQKATVTDYKMTDFGSLRLKAEGANIQYDDPIGEQTKQASPVRFALGYKITDETLKHELYGMMDRLEGGLMKSAIDGQETIAAYVLNGAFATTNYDGYSSTGFDGLQLCSTAHPKMDGSGNQRNRPSTDANLGVTALQQALIDIENWKDDRGRPSQHRAKLLIISPEDKFTAKELTGSEYKPGTANNEINALKDEGLSFMVSHYKTDTNAWFIACDRTGVHFVWETKPRQGVEDDFDSEVVKRKCVQGFVVYHNEWRGIWGTSGGS
jgi:hypothetical protein